MTSLLTPSDVAQQLQIPYESALKWIRLSGIQYYKIGRQIRVQQKDLDKFFSEPEARMKIRIMK